MICPKCKTENTDDWPIHVNGKVVEGGCQNCWEKESSAAWWIAVVQLDNIIHFEEK